MNLPSWFFVEFKIGRVNSLFDFRQGIDEIIGTDPLKTERVKLLFRGSRITDRGSRCHFWYLRLSFSFLSWSEKPLDLVIQVVLATKKLEQVLRYRPLFWFYSKLVPTPFSSSGDEFFFLAFREEVFLGA